MAAAPDGGGKVLGVLVHADHAVEHPDSGRFLDEPPVLLDRRLLLRLQLARGLVRGAFAVELRLKRTRMGSIVVCSRGKWWECRVVGWWLRLARDRGPGGGGGGDVGALSLPLPLPLSLLSRHFFTGVLLACLFICTGFIVWGPPFVFVRGSLAVEGLEFGQDNSNVRHNEVTDPDGGRGRRFRMASGIAITLTKCRLLRVTILQREGKFAVVCGPATLSVQFTDA
jgi:hypothetical protein